MPKNRNPEHTDFLELKDAFESGTQIRDIINQIKPTTKCCSRLIYYIANHRNDDLDKENNVHDVIRYIDDNQMSKDGSYYSAVIGVLSYYNNIELQEKYMKEMEEDDINLRICHYQHYIQSCHNLFVETDNVDMFDKIFESVKDAKKHSLEINDELFIILFRTIIIASKHPNLQDKINKTLLDVLILLSDNINILNSTIYDKFKEMIKNFNVTKDETFYLTPSEGCGEPHNLAQREITAESYEQLQKLWVSSFTTQKIKSTLKNALKHFKHHNDKFLRPDWPVVIIDGANLGYAVNLKKCHNFYRKIDTAVKYFHENDWNVIIFLHKSHIDEYGGLEENYKIVESWKNPTQHIVRYDINATTKECSDDFVWILAGFYYNNARDNRDAYVLTNDQMKNHHDNEKLNDKLFFRWRNNHQITYDFKYRDNKRTGFMDFKLVPHMPPTFDHFTRFRYDGKTMIIYVPFSDDEMKKRNERVENEIDHIGKFHNACKTVQWNRIQINIDILAEHYPRLH